MVVFKKNLSLFGLRNHSRASLKCLFCLNHGLTPIALISRIYVLSDIAGGM